jgi:NADH-quinone oxidoreductase subunit F
MLANLSDNMAGKTLCALADFAAGPVLSSLKHFFDEYEQHVRDGACPLGKQRVLATA